jgi:NADPH:quinone reductase-like Zn-dependent oxidoreductase
MKAAVIHEFGGPDVLKYEDFPDPKPGPGQVLVRVTAASINPVDLSWRQGQRKDIISLPAVLGWDLSGTIVALGDGVQNLSVGDEVFGWDEHTYAELCAVDASAVAKLPVGLDPVKAAALPLVCSTGFRLISESGEAKGGETVLVSGANGAVGRSAVFAAKDRGCIVIAGVRAKDIASASKIGADRVVALDDDAAMADLEPVDLVANTVRGPTATQLLAKVKSGGRFASVTGAPNGADAFPQVRIKTQVSKQDARTYLYAANAVLDGRLHIAISMTLPLSQAAQGHAAVERGGIGKVLLKP